MKKNIGRAVIVGASSGIGYEVARLLIADGWTVALAARRTAHLEALKQLAPSRVYTACIDITHPKADEGSVATNRKHGRHRFVFSCLEHRQPKPHLATRHRVANHAHQCPWIHTDDRCSLSLFRFTRQGAHCCHIVYCWHPWFRSSTRLLCHQSTAKHLHRVACTIIAHAGTSHPLYRPSSRLCAHPFIGQRRQLPHADAS